MADPAIAPSVLLKGKSLLEDPDALARAVETAFFKHVFTRYYERSIGFSYWRGKRGQEVDIIADMSDRLVPFEVKYRDPKHTGLADLKGLVELCTEHDVKAGYVITRDFADFDVLGVEGGKGLIKLLRIPAPLACYWLGRSELESASRP